MAYLIRVKTGDVTGSGTDANVYVILHDKDGRSSEKLKLDNLLKNDFERGNTDVFKIDAKKLRSVSIPKTVELWRDSYGVGDSWFLDRISFENKLNNTILIFPVFSWIRADYHYVFREIDTMLPQDDDMPEQRKTRLDEKRIRYKLIYSEDTMTTKVAELPEEEEFSFSRQWDKNIQKFSLLIKSKFTEFSTGEWSNLESIKKIYSPKSLVLPNTWKYWNEDWYFGYQRTAGVNPYVISLCTRIPDKLAVDEAMLSPFLEGKSLESAIVDKKLFICDLDILDGLKLKANNSPMCSPILLLFLTSKDELKPVAIQLFQEPSPENPVFLPSDDRYTWLLAKMWYNNAEANHHQCVSHLGYTHLLMEGICLITHRELSTSHPAFKLLAPHFHCLLATNT